MAIQFNLSAKSLCYFLSLISLNFLVKHIMDVSYLVATTTRPSRQSAIILVSIDNFLSQSVNNGLKFILHRVWDRMLNTAFHKTEQLPIATTSQFSGAWNILKMKSTMLAYNLLFYALLLLFLLFWVDNSQEIYQTIYTCHIMVVSLFCRSQDCNILLSSPRRKIVIQFFY